MAVAIAAGVSACAATPAGPLDDAALSERLVALERQSWVAWQSHDGAFFAGFLSDDHVELGPGGPAGKAALVRFVLSGACKVESYAVGDFRFTRLSESSAALVYRAEQRTACGGHAVASPAWATSVYALRDGQWKNVLYQHLPAPAPAQRKPG